MKNESKESPDQYSAVPGSAEIYDFLYVDRARISALYAQLIPQGILQSVKTTQQQSFSDDRTLGGNIQVVKAESKTNEAGAEGIERMFDASWSVPLEVLDMLQARSLVSDSVTGASLGSIILSGCHLRLIDYASMEDLWEPAMRIFRASTTADLPMVDETLGILKAMPHVIHAHLLTEDAFLWASLQPSGLTIPTTDITLKHGGVVPGNWKALYVLDTWLDHGVAPDTKSWSAGDITDGVLTMMHAMRTAMGRPASWLGITPLMIFRSISPVVAA